MPQSTKPSENVLRISYKIPCSPLLKKILEKHLNTSPFKLSTKTLTGKIMLGLMVVKETSKSKQHFGDEIFEIEIPNYYWTHYPLKGISDQHAAVLLNFHYNKFTENLFCFIDSRLILRQEGDVRLRLSIKSAILEFCKSFSISDDDIMLDTLIKDYTRSRNNGQTIATSYVRKKTMNVSILKQPECKA
jgi:hypothetical protein